MKKIHKMLLLLLLFIAIQFTFGIYNTYAANIEIKFRESNIYNKVLEELKNKYSLEPRKDDDNYTITMGTENIEKVDALQLNNSNISKIRGLENFYNLKNLDISNNEIADISCLAGLSNLTKLTAYGNEISNISALSNLTKIKYLNIAKNKLKDSSDTSTILKNLSKLIDLTELDISHNYICYLNGIESLTKLEKLNLYDNSIRNVAPIGVLTNLEELNLGQNNEFKDHTISGLANLNNLQKLKYFNFAENYTSSILGNISNLQNLETLQLQGNEITNINSGNQTNNYIKLKKLNLYDNKIKDISILAYLTNLEEIILGKNDIRKITSIINDNNIVWPKLNKIDLSGNTYLHQIIEGENQTDATTRINNNKAVIRKIYEKNIEINYEYLTDTTNLPHTDAKGIKYVTYEDFGAKCNGEYDDFIAIRNAQLFANENNCEVRGTKDKTYHIFKYYEDALVVKTNIDWQGANIVIHDEEIENESGRYKHIFCVHNFEDTIIIKNPKWKIGKGTTNIKKEIKVQLEELNKKGYTKYFCIALNEEKKQYIRYGANANSGSNQVDFFNIDNEGNILNDIQWDFDNITSFTIYGIPNEENTITIKNGNLITNSFYSKSEAVKSAGPKKPEYYERNLLILESANVNITGIKHTLTKDTLSGSYHGIIRVIRGTNINIDECELFTRKKTKQSTYDLHINSVINSKFTNIKSNEIYDINRWGITGTNYCKDVIFDNCIINRIDAHRGIYNLTIKNCTIGSKGLTMTGQGDLNIENTIVTATKFIMLRDDYGSVWDGNVNIINSTYRHIGTDVPKLVNFKVSLEEDGSMHDFGYECKFPNVYVENLIIDNTYNKTHKDMYIIPNSDSNCAKLDKNYWPDNVYINGYKFINNTLNNPSIKLKQTNYGNINTNFVVTDCKLKLNGSSGQDITDMFDFNKTLKTDKNVYFEISPNDSASNVISIYKDNNKIEENLKINKLQNFQFTENGNYKIEIKSNDNINNKVGTKTYEFNIDKTTPTPDPDPDPDPTPALNLTISKSPEGKTNGNVTVTVKANKEIQEIGNDWKLSSDKKTLTKTYSKNSTEEITVKDLAGNETKETIKIENIDKSGPKLKLITTLSENKATCTATITADEEIQEVGGGWILSKDKKSLTKKYENNTTEDITVKDLLGNKTICKVTIIEIEKIFSSNTYAIENNTIKNIQPNTKYEDLVKNITSNQEYTIKEGDTIITEKIIKTGQILTVGEKKYTLIVTGDVNGDGKANIHDILNMNKHRLNKVQLKEAYFEAGDVNKDNKVDIRDMLKVNQYRLGKASNI